MNLAKGTLCGDVCSCKHMWSFDSTFMWCTIFAEMTVILAQKSKSNYKSRSYLFNEYNYEKRHYRLLKFFLKIHLLLLLSYTSIYPNATTISLPPA